MSNSTSVGRFRLGTLPAILGTVALATLALVAGPARAQDAQYWTIQYGNRARMLGGAVIGSTDDVSAVFYNPGALAMNADRELLLAGNVVQYTTLTVRGALDANEDLKQSQFGGIPSLFAGEFRFKWLGSSRLAYSFLTRQAMGIRVQQRGDLRENATGEFAQLAGDLRVDQSLSEYWAGLTWSAPLGSRFGVGITAFAASRTHRWSGQTTIQAQNEQGTRPSRWWAGSSATRTGVCWPSSGSATRKGRLHWGSPCRHRASRSWDRATWAWTSRS